ncbi:hypothetical protein [Nostoc sp.]|uniref:hypothetical protein n=1 Tax=Nostoc sp. TaxID=1180 RepID=UPI002FEF7691
MSRLLFVFQNDSSLYLPIGIEAQKNKIDYDRILELQAQGMRVGVIAREVNLSASRVRQICSKFKRREGNEEREFSRKMKVERNRVFRKKVKILISTKIIRAFSGIDLLFTLYFQYIRRLKKRAFIDVGLLGLSANHTIKLKAAKINSIQSLLIYYADKAYKEIGDILWEAIANFLDYEIFALK